MECNKLFLLHVVSINMLEGKISSLFLQRRDIRRSYGSTFQMKGRRDLSST